MGVLDKIKNALFEVEYVEVDEPPKVDKKKKKLEKEKKKVEVEKSTESKPIAKRVVLPGKKEEKIEKLEEEELKDDNFEARPIDENIKEEPKKDTFKFIDDNEFRDEDYVKSEPEIVKVIEKDNVEEEKVVERVDPEPRRVSRSNYVENKVEDFTFDNSTSNDSKNNYVSEMKNNSFDYKTDNYQNNSKPYGMDKSYKIPVHEYGTYEKEEKSVFKPSPIISPIYGILDKNYKKEDVVQKKEIRLTSSYSRSNVSVDDVRNKALGVESDLKKTESKNDNSTHQATTFEVDDGEDDDLLVDLTDNKEKPEVKELTMGDALEYFQDLGLEYNVDYVDASKKNVVKKADEITSKETTPKTSISEVLKKEVGESPKDDEKTEESKSTVIKNESSDNEDTDDDNLFDLIDSMYEEKGE